MTVTTEYELAFVQFLDLASTAAAMDLTGLAGGGLAGLGDVGDHVEASFFDDSLSPAGSAEDIAGLKGSLDQLTNGNVVIATEVGSTSLSFRIETAAGDPVLADTVAGDDNTTAADVAALAGGGFAIAVQDQVDADHDIEIVLCSAAGDILGQVEPDLTTADDKAPAVTGLVDGGFAVAWTRDLGEGVTQAWHAVYNANGTVRESAEALDTAGDENTAMAIVGLNNGGYAVAYQDSGWTGTGLEITLAFIDPNGDPIDAMRVTQGGGDDTAPALTLLSNGMIAVSWSNGGGGDRDIRMQLVDPDTRLKVGDPAVIADSDAEELDSAVAGWGLARVAVSFEGGSLDVQTYQLKRTSTGDAAADTVVGDDAVDIMSGGGGGDSLSGFGNDDTLSGETGNDTLDGGAGDDDLRGGDNPDRLVGSLGDDTISGGGSLDTILGGAGDDLVFGGFGADGMAGGTGSDTLDYSALAGETFLDLGFNGPQNTRSGGNDSILGFENVRTGEGDDRIFGSGQINFIDTAGGADTIKAADGLDIVFAGDGDDKVNGGGGGDNISGGGGRDRIRGGLGSDTFEYGLLEDSAVGVGLCDVIRDFRTSDGDVILLMHVLPGGVYIGAADFSGTGGGEVRVEVVAEGQLVQVDADGDGASDMDILVQNSGLTGGAADFGL